MLERSKRGRDVAIECWRLDGGGRTAVLASFDGGCPALVHFGRALPEGEDLVSLSRMTMPNVAGGQLDPVVPLTLLPTAMDGWQGNPGIKLAGDPAPRLRLEAMQTGGDGLSLTARITGSAGVGIAVRLSPETGLLTVILTPDDAAAGWLAAAIPVPASLTRIIDHGGRWCGEFRRQETRFVTGRHVRESHEGRTGHAHFPGAVFATDACGETTGQCLGVTMAWSGGHRMVAEEIPDGRRQVQFGFADGTSVHPREIVVGWSDTGFSGLSQAMQAHVRNGLPKKVARPVHYNCWEAVYFRHSVDELKEIATIAAGLGAERFVLDDGWFKGRNDDTSSLGDWTVDPVKYPDGLHPLVDHINALGMEFGIWFEPEMVNADSDLCRARPDWVLGPVDQPSGRKQFVLDLTKPGVTAHLFDAISAILAAYPVTYIKWDHNRILTGGGPAQAEALYLLLDRLNAAFPQVEIETCSSGGGRIDYGILERTTRVWLSDSNDALERLRMQHEASRWLPAEVQGSHVGPRTCHTSGRQLTMAFRAWVAASRHMGMEMDPRELTDEEAGTLKSVIAWYKANRDFLFSAVHARIESHDPEVFAESFTARDKDRFILFKGQAGASAQIAARPLAVPGLDPDALYELRIAAPCPMARNLNQNDATGLASAAAVRLSGAALSAGALRLPNAFPETMMVVEGNRIDSRKGPRR